MNKNSLFWNRVSIENVCKTGKTKLVKEKKDE